MDRGLAVSWYDVVDAELADYLAWAHGSLMPTVLRHPDVLWIAHYACRRYTIPACVKHTAETVPAGSEYMMLIGAETAHAFCKSASAYAAGVPAEYFVDLSAHDKKHLRMRRNERRCVFTEEARCIGPAAKLRASDGGTAACIELGSFNADSVAAEEEMLAWYGDWRMQALSTTPGCLGMRKYVSVAGWAKHAVLYEFSSLEKRDEAMKVLPARFPEMEAWNARCIPKLTHSPGSPHIGERLWPPIPV